VGSGIYSSIWSNDDIRMIDWAEYIQNFAYPGPFLIHNPGIGSGEINLITSGLLALDN